MVSHYFRLRRRNAATTTTTMMTTAPMTRYVIVGPSPVGGITTEVGVGATVTTGVVVGTTTLGVGVGAGGVTTGVGVTTAGATAVSTASAHCPIEGP